MKEIYLTNSNRKVLVDDEDYDYLIKYNSSWRLYANSYARSSDGILMHRLIWSKYNKIVPRVLDHKDLNGLNNQKYNLRSATGILNGHNRKFSKNNTSGYKGVFWRPETNNWWCVVQFNNEWVYTGYFETKRDAAIANDIVVKKYISEDIYINCQDATKQEIDRITEIINNIKKRNGTSKYKGVSFDKSKNKWRSSLCLNRNIIRFGDFNTEKEAVIAYNNGIKKLLGDKAILNNINE